MFIIGLTITAVGFLADLLLRPTRGRPGYLRRTTVMNDPGFGGYPAPLRRVIEEEEAGPPGY
jgi:hypothetical protein